MGKVQAIDVFHVWIWALLTYASWKGAYRKGCARRIHMGKLIYLTIASLDGYVADEDGEFGWAAPDEQVHAFINDLVRGVGTYLYGRRMYEVMRYWETADASSGRPDAGRDFAQIWQSADKIVYSRTLRSVSTARTRIERDFDVAALRREKARAGGDIGVGGPELAARALEAGLVDELRLFVAPILVGGGTRSLPDNVRLEVELLDERRFAGGMVYLHYRIVGSDGAHQGLSKI
jgi:dihydrofolate reductase